ATLTTTMQTLIAKMKKLLTRRKRNVGTVRTKRDKTPEDKLEKLGDEWTMTQKNILTKPTKVQLQHLKKFKRKIKEYRKKNNIKEAHDIPLLEFGENDTDKLRKRICDEFYEHTKPKESYLISKEEMVAILPLIISAKTPFRETIMEIITKLEKDETQQISITKIFDEVDNELTNNGTKWFDQNRIKQPFQGKTESILSYIERFEKYMEVHHGFSTNIEKDKIKGELLIREFIKGVAPRVKKEQATLIHMNVSYGELKKSLMKYSTYENEERREQNCQINNIHKNIRLLDRMPCHRRRHTIQINYWN
uniref:Retrotrans_gag domain-containing protein n=1 Tax=Strongyloides venezuelensis TaxID=75913 RepID=A0A0K0FS01_STRVS